jgi:hypothetical protein
MSTSSKVIDLSLTVAKLVWATYSVIVSSSFVIVALYILLFFLMVIIGDLTGWYRIEDYMTMN